MSTQADGGKGEADAFNRKLRVQLEQEWGDLQNLKRAYAAPQAECAPREAQPDELMRILTEYEGALQEDDEEVIAPAREALLSFLRPILAQMKESAPTPERAQDIQQEYYKKGFNEGRAIGRTERADAEKDAALTDEWALFNAWLREDICRLHMSALDAQFSAWQARAILTAKEKK